MTKSNAELSAEVEALTLQVSELIRRIDTLTIPNVDDINIRLDGMAKQLSSLTDTVSENATEQNNILDTLKTVTSDVEMFRERNETGHAVDFFREAGNLPDQKTGHLLDWLSIVLHKYYANEMPTLPVAEVIDGDDMVIVRNDDPSFVRRI